MEADTRETAPLLFVDGAAIDSEGVRIFIGAAFQSNDTLDGRAVLAFQDDTWSSFDLPDKLASVSASLHGSEFFALTKSGVVAIAADKGIVFEKIADAGVEAGGYGYMKRINHISGGLFACGDLRQIYRRVDGRWMHFDRNVLSEDRYAVADALNDIDGISASNLYAVGDHGNIFYNDGHQWNYVSAPTNVDLERVICVASDEIYIAGNNGLLLRGCHSKLEIAADAGIRSRFWGLADNQGTIFTCSARAVYAYRNGTLEAVPITIPFKGALHRLTASKEYLWAVGTNSILKFDGARWEELIYPYNRPRQT